MLAPARTPAVSHLPIPDTSPNNHCKMISLYTRGAAVENSSIIASPVPWIHWDDHRSKLKLFCQFSTRYDLTITFKLIWLWSGFSSTLKGACIVYGAHVAILVIWRDTIFFEMIVDVFWLLVGDAIRAAIYNLLLGKGHEVFFQIVWEFVLSISEDYFLIDFELHHCCDCKYVRGIKVAHIFHLRHILTPIIEVIVLKLCDFEVFLGFGKGSDGMIQLLKLCLSDIGKAPDLIIELFI